MLDRDSQDKLKICGINATDIAREYGTPTYIYSEKKVIENYRLLEKSLETLPFKAKIFYAIKSCNNPHIASLLVNCGAGIDAASPNEIILAELLGLTNKDILFTGNNLSDEDIEFAVKKDVIFNVDDETILPRIFKYGIPSILSFRINPGGDTSVTGQQTFGGAQAKFGISPENAIRAYADAKNGGITKFGIHMMPGSCALDVDYFRENTKILLKLAEQIHEELDIQFNFIDLGGGLGIPYRDNQDALDLDAVSKAISIELKNINDKILEPEGMIYMEPARFFVGNAGVLLGKVHSIKPRESGHIIGTDISMNVLARPAMYKEDGGYHRLRFDGSSDDATVIAGICGQVCENTDFWDKNRKVPNSIEVNDLVIALDAGAYGYSMSYQYNGRLKPAEILITNEGKVKLIRNREEVKDMLNNIPNKDVFFKKIDDL